MATKKHLNNDQFFLALVKGKLTPEISPVMLQMFLLDALSKFSERVANAAPEDIDTGAFIHPQSWIATGAAVNKAIKENYSL